MRGTSFGDDDASIVERLQNPSMRPSTVRGCSFEDDNGIPEKPYDPQDNIIMPKGGLRQLSIRGTSCGDDDGGGVPKKPHKPDHTFIKSNKSMRPSTTRGASFGDDDGGADVLEKPQEPVQKPDKPRRGIRPSTVRADDDGGGAIPEKPQEPVHTFIKSNKSMRPSATRGLSFGDDDGGGIPEKPQGKDVQPSSPIRGASGTSRLIKPAPPANKIPLDPEKCRKCKACYTLYVWMGHPNRTDMKRRVADMTEGCDITVADVDDLPWMPGGKRLNVIEVNKLIIMK
jgi:hypothetical protein